MASAAPKLQAVSKLQVAREFLAVPMSLWARLPIQVRATLSGVPTRDSPAVRYGYYGLVVHTLILAAMVLLAAGVLLPFLTVKKFMILADSQSLAQIVGYLYREGDVFLAMVVLAFSIVVPFAKIATLYRLWSIGFAGGDRVRRLLAVLEFVGKWSMVEVFVAAAVVFSAKSSGIADATTEPGLYCFAASVMLSLVALYLVQRATRDRPLA